MSESRQRLRPWLEAQINSGRIPGLQWLDYQRKTFRIPWKHAGKQGWQEGDSIIFKSWAEHTGKFVEGVDRPEYATWKTRLRMALTKSCYIDEIKVQSRPDSEEPYRVYRFLSPSEATKKNKAFSNLQATLYGDDENPVWTSQNYVHDHDCHSVLPMDEEFDAIKSDDLLRCGVLDQPEYANGGAPDPMEGLQQGVAPWTLPLTPGNGPVTTATGHGLSTSQGMSGVHSGQSTPTTTTQANTPGPGMTVKLFHRTSEVAQYEMNNPNGTRLFYDSTNLGSSPNLAEVAKIYAKEMGDQLNQLFGPSAVSQYKMPSWGCIRQQELANKLLHSMERGLLLQCIDGDIFATRLSKCVIFSSSPQKEGEIVKLRRDRGNVKIFDFHNDFLPAVKRYIQGTGPRPCIEVRIGFGQRWAELGSWPQQDILISGTVISVKALQILQQLDYEANTLLSIQVSDSDDFDRIAETIKKLYEVKSSGFTQSIARTSVQATRSQFQKEFPDMEMF